MVHDTPLTKEMSDSSEESGSTPEVPPLTSLTADGNCYKRSAPVECEIGKILRLPQSKWPGAARHVQNETLVFMVRQTRCADRDLHERLVDALEKRIFLIAGRFVWGFDEDIIEDIKLEAEAQILDLVFAETPSRQSEFLEITLVEAIECRVKDAVEKYTNSTAGRCVELALEPDEDSDDIERPI